ncbi:ATP-dependent DNA helicase RecG [Acidithiobacillus sp. IBUN Pt1247-S3]|uniref:ATP-dependent DNA helicase RecG n=1 Tax=Acidithiobacillus sp. IBUN Pt1247-S3 TaxID=3166642 RepID=UPI0034E54453
MAGGKAATRLWPQDSLTALPGIGPALAERMANLGLERIEDLLFHLPLRFQDRRRMLPITVLRPGMECAVLGEIVDLQRQQGRREQWLLRLRDGGPSTLTLRFFHLSPALRQQWHSGRRLWCFGELRSGLHGLEMVHPEWQIADRADFHPPEHLTPFYPSTQGIHQQQWRRFIAAALALLPTLADPIRDLLPGWPTLADSICYLHRGAERAPTPCDREWQRLALEELLAHHLALRRERERETTQQIVACAADARLWQQLRAGLPFFPTAAQDKVIAEAVADLTGSRPMRRLVQGDVGSGKTLVATAVLLHAVAAGMQVAVMAPTEILAVQLYERLQSWLAHLNVSVGLLLGSQGLRQRRAAMTDLQEGKLSVVCGTQALFQENVEFSRLGLVIIDEQHRFGVDQRRRLLEKGNMPHLLVMTATPIPRTLAMTLHADLDLSTIDALPPGRQPIDTLVLADDRREDLIQRLHHLLAAGRQVYWVCPLIEESELLQLQAAETSYADLQIALPDTAIGLMHGRQRSEEKAQIMEAFRGGELRILVATTVIEVGVDVPNASVMVVEHAERLGLAQLHQLRGRVGRGAQASICILMYHAPLSAKARERLRIMRESQDGFVIARKDLEMRGPGEFLGVRQSGERQLRIADLFRDEELLDLLPQLAERLEYDYPEAVDLLIRRWLGSATAYAGVG